MARGIFTILGDIINLALINLTSRKKGMKSEPLMSEKQSQMSGEFVWLTVAPSEASSAEQSWPPSEPPWTITTEPPGTFVTNNSSFWLTEATTETTASVFAATTEVTLCPPVGTAGPDPTSAVVEDGLSHTVHGPRYHKQLRIILIVVMIVVSLFGNTMAMKRIYHRWSRRSRTTALFFHLTLADLAVTCFTMLSQVTWEVLDREWVAGDVFCRVNKFAQTFAITSSNFILVSIAVDRCLAVVYPLRVWASPHWLALVAWFTSLLPSLPNTYTFHQVKQSGGTFCVSKFYTGELSTQVRQVYMMSIFLMVTVAPFILLVLLYTVILMSMSRHDRKFSRRCTYSDGSTQTGPPEFVTTSVQRQQQQDEEENDEFGDITDDDRLDEDQSFGGRNGDSSIIFREAESQRPRIRNSILPRAKVKTLNLSIAVVVTFLITNLPYLAYEMCIAFHIPLELKPEAVAVMGIVSASNSVINPFIYLLFQSRSRMARKLTTMCCMCTLQQETNTSQPLRVVFKKKKSCSSIFSGSRDRPNNLAHIRNDIQGPQDTPPESLQSPDDVGGYIHLHPPSQSVSVSQPFIFVSSETDV